jgi:hypothetical protein
VTCSAARPNSSYCQPEYAGALPFPGHSLWGQLPELWRPRQFGNQSDQLVSADLPCATKLKLGNHAMANYSTSRTSGDVDLESEKSDPLQLRPASSTASQVAKSVRHLLTDPRQFYILQSALAGGDRMRFDQLKRRDVLTLIGGATTWSLVGHRPSSSTSLAIWRPLHSRRRHRKHKELGYLEGRDYEMVRKSAERVAERLPVLAAEMVRLKPDLRQ